MELYYFGQLLMVKGIFPFSIRVQIRQTTETLAIHNDTLFDRG